ncbi:MAG TPA: hypothetical protein VGD21_05915 [Lysobacter sp.]
MNISIATFDAIHAAQADVVGAGAIRPRTTLHRRVVINAVSGVAALSVLVAGMLWLGASGNDGPPSTDNAALEITTPPTNPTSPLYGEDAANVATSTAPPYAMEPAGVARQGTDIVIDLHGQSRLQAARQLAELTDSQLMEGTGLLARAAPVTLQWRGRDPLDAWRRLLGENIRHVVHCQAGGCRVWVLALNASSTAAAATPDGLGADESTVQATPTATAEQEPAAEIHVAPMNTPTPPDE